LTGNICYNHAAVSKGRVQLAIYGVTQKEKIERISTQGSGHNDLSIRLNGRFAWPVANPANVSNDEATVAKRRVKVAWRQEYSGRR
jgi:hypothetical protein